MRMLTLLFLSTSVAVPVLAADPPEVFATAGAVKGYLDEPFKFAGGAGTRLWPLSREAYPKQFHRLTGPETLFQQTCRRLSGPLVGDLFVILPELQKAL